eukprot:TRINITY_DN21351_c0_g1_i1.p1 TRINITY_DN21351_c0_g1~~TRINITY_DN21351_c0_g1_i1.p1  ORF type:complete len:314 (+),score=51.01 TRINITY_DN21351_c0_g1_i1:386-1327(+)
MEIEKSVSEKGREELQAKFASALAVVHTALDEYGGPEHVALSFNGGKDCTVILHIIRAAFARYQPARVATLQNTIGPPWQDKEAGGLRPSEERSDPFASSSESLANGFAEPSNGLLPPSSQEESHTLPRQTVAEEASHGATLPRRIKTIYFDSDDVFREIKDFTHDCVDRYNLELLTYREGYREGVEKVVKAGIQAIFLGTRSVDPNGREQGVFSPSSEGWPKFMRVNPIFHWTYRDVWDFLRVTGVPYCSLYDDGYTSIGKVHNTFRCTALRRPDGSYAPAHELEDGTQERRGREMAPSRPVRFRGSERAVE